MNNSWQHAGTGTLWKDQANPETKTSQTKNSRRIQLQKLHGTKKK